MATDDPIRASDVDREAVVTALREAYTAGRLTLDEFDERMSAAYASKTWGDLRQLTIDLPTQPILGTDVPGRLPQPPGELPSHPRRPGPELESSDAGSRPQPRPQGSPVRARRPAAMLVPIAIWTLLVAHSGTVSPVLFVIIVVFLFAAITSAFRRR